MSAARPPAHALWWSGGKDSYLALLRSRRQGRHVTTLVNLFDQASGRVRFHAVPRELIARQALSLGLRLRQHPTHPESYEAVFRRTLDDLHAAGHAAAVFGNIHLADVRAWFEERVRAAALEHVEPLWGEPPAALLEEFVGTGARAVVTCCETAKLSASWLGRPVDDGFVTDLARHRDVDPCGERGEYHTFVYDGPLFTEPVRWRAGGIREEGGFAQLELVAR